MFGGMVVELLFEWSQVIEQVYVEVVCGNQWWCLLCVDVCQGIEVECVQCVGVMVVLCIMVQYVWCSDVVFLVVCGYQCVMQFDYVVQVQVYVLFGQWMYCVCCVVEQYQVFGVVVFGQFQLQWECGVGVGVDNLVQVKVVGYVYGVVECCFVQCQYVCGFVFRQ